MGYPQIQHHGAKDGVTGSCHQLRMNAPNSLLTDCGLFQGNDASIPGEPSADRLAIEFPLDTIKALVATHVHIDHVGRIPYLLTARFYGPILCSEPSAKLLPIVLEDAFKLGFSRDRAKVEKYIQLVGQRIVALPNKQWFTLRDTDELLARIRLQRAGHIFGSAYVEIDRQSHGPPAHRPASGPNRTTGYRHSRRRHVQRRPYRQSSEGRAWRQKAQRSVRRFSSQGHPRT